MNFQVCLQKRGHSKSSDLVEIRSVKEVSEPLGKARPTIPPMASLQSVASAHTRFFSEACPVHTKT